MEIVKASPNDFRALGKFARHTYECAYGLEIELTVLYQHLTLNMSDECFQEALAEDDIYLAFSNNQLVGFAQLGQVNSNYEVHLEEFDQDASELRRLYVEPELQRLGIGSTLLSRAVKSSVHPVYLTTWETNLNAQRFYAKHGFEKIGRIPEYSTVGCLNGYEYIMVRKLSYSASYTLQF